MTFKRAMLANLNIAILTAVGSSCVSDSAVVPIEGEIKHPILSSESRTPQSRVVSLITGDKITVLSNDLKNIEITPGEGREHIHFTRKNTPGKNSVIPDDVLPLIRAGKLDPQLFDIGLLLKNAELRKRSAERIPIIVEYSGAGKAARSSAMRNFAFPLPSSYQMYRDLNYAAMEVAGDGQLWQMMQPTQTARRSSTPGFADGVEKIWLDGLNQVVLDVSSPLVAAPAAHAMGYDGSGVVVAVLDSGIDATHPDLAGKVIEAADFSLLDPGLEDKIGHGTHVASTIAGSGTASGGTYQGVAPGAQLLNARVCGLGFCSDSSVLAGLEWAAERGAQVANMSLGKRDTPGIDPVEAAVNLLTEEYDMLIVVAAGNSGANFTVGSPASADSALTVAAIDDDRQLAFFSSRGPRIDDYAAKPDIAAPGVNIVAAASSSVHTDTDYVSSSGTSMATPHVAGAAAILRQRYPEKTAGQIKSLLMSSANPSPTLNGFQQGAGALDILAALDQRITTTPRSLSCGGFLFPHGDDIPVTQTVEFFNPSSEAVTLDLNLQVATEDLPAGVFTVSPQTLQIPAGGSAAAVFSCDSNLGGEAYGSIGGTLVATSDSDTVSVPFGMFRETEMYNVTFVQKSRSGLEPIRTDGAILAIDGDPKYPFGEAWGFSSYGEFTYRIPRKWYFKRSLMIEETAEGKLHTYIQSDPFELTEDMVIVFDSGLATEVKKPTVFNPKAELAKFQFGQFHRAPVGDTILQSVIAPEDRLFLLLEEDALNASITPNTKIKWAIIANWTQKDAQGQVKKTYNAAWKADGNIPQEFEVHLQRSEFAKIRTSYHPHGTNSSATSRVDVLWDNPHSVYPDIENAQAFPVSLPSKVDNYVHSSSPDLFWHIRFVERDQETDKNIQVIDTPEKSYLANKNYHLALGKAVTSPKLESRWRTAPYMTSRRGNLLSIYLGLFGGLGSAEYTARLSKDGVVLLETDDDLWYIFSSWLELTVPSEPGLYQWDIEGTRTMSHTLAPKVTASWTFHSEYVDEETYVQLPLGMFTFRPNVDAMNAAKANRTDFVPVTVSSATGGHWSKPEIDVSYDGGESWKRVKVRRHKSWWSPWKKSWKMKLRYPKLSFGESDRFVSLRASSTDTEGNSTTQTILNAYRLRR